MEEKDNSHLHQVTLDSGMLYLLSNYSFHTGEMWNLTPSFDHTGALWKQASPAVPKHVERTIAC